jgi:tetratricopeptide (TPR) repeat protein
MKRLSLLVLCLLLLLLSCGPIRKESLSADTSAQAASRRSVQTAPVSPAPAAPVATPVKGPPAPEFTPELLYRLLVAEIAGQRGDVRDAARFYLEAARISKDPRVAERATRIALFAHDKDMAREASRLWLALAPESTDAREFQVLLLFDQGQYAAALEHLDKLATAGNKPPLDRFMEIAALLERAGHRRQALDLMEKLTARHPQSPEALFAYSSFALSAGELQRAQTIVEQALARRPDWPEAAVLRARILHLQHNTAQALSYLKDLSTRHPQDRVLQLGYARLLIDADRLDEAIAQFQVLAKAAPDDDDVLFALGLLSLQTGRTDEAQGHFQRLVEMGKKTSEASYFLGQIAESKRQFEQAQAWYGKVQAGEYYVDSRIRLATVAARRGDVPSALQQLQELPVKSRDDAVHVSLAQGEVLTAAGRLQEARAAYDAALKKFPEETDLLYARALLAEKMGNLAQTEEDLRKILAAEPENAQALNALGYTLADRTDRYQEALGYIRKALELRPNDPYILDSLGWVSYKLGQHQEALTTLRKALELQQDAEIAAHLGEVLWATGDKQQAREVWQRALKSHPDSQPLHDVMQRFAR